MRKTPIAAGLATTFIVAASQLADPSSAEAATPETPADACAQAISEDSAEAPNSQSLDRSDLNCARHSLRQAIITDEVQLRTATNPGVVSRADVTRVDGNLFAEVKLSTDDTLVVQLNDDYEVVHYRETQIEEHTATSGRV
ncbi:MAG TPA: hypothetical protein VK028_04190, partial [Micromonosporaceae bacterium]|nr:hypothetical protein [Micromonosporaceae bacterium]